ncbi:type II and III secretion system protein family protein [Thaumasiovibrio subtropicus]|uniref:type II and III secretion system protein family protein n=1 Tax=Thaumasiovibrio subtropicus TaxID=1891207 RepID=UPI000B36291B|nr:pilus assembly protein N-terminal domain-containing protein [Thaumasiovibrio subtropicus]
MQRVIGFLALLMVFPTMAARIVNLGQDEATTLVFEQPIETVFITNPEIADYQVIDEKRLVVFGRAVGNASLLVFGANRTTLANRKLVVNKSLTHIQQQIAINHPNAEITVTNLGDQVVLTGTVSSDRERQAIYSLVGELLGKDYDDYKINWDIGEKSLEIDFMTRRRYAGLVNNIELATTKQVNVKLSIAEVSHTFLQELGVRWGSIVGDGTFAGNGQFADFVTNFSADDIALFISAVDDDSVGQILAEPNLSVISGETASFLVGGEIPIVVFINDTYTVSYKEFGIRLEVAARVLEDDQIKLSLMPEVSAVDVSYRSEVLDIPSFRTRRARTTVELGDGQSFVLGGLLNTEDRETLSKIPLIGDVPILGSLFRHTQTERRKTELIIVATVNLVEPVQATQIQLPTIQRTSTLSRFLGIKPTTSPKTQQWAEEILMTGGFKQ